MLIAIDSLTLIKQLKAGDILLQTARNERFQIVHIEDDFLFVSPPEEQRALKMVRFRDLIQDAWQLVDSPRFEKMVSLWPDA